MKINRLLEITTILLNHRTVTAAELAERFGVSTRTIYRDIDVLSSSGVPVFSTQGANGGISILEDYTLNRTAISEQESRHIIFALQSLRATKYPEVDAILEKLGALFHSSDADWISIDFLPWGAPPNEYNKFDIIKNAVIHSKIIEFDYINANNTRSHRRLAPVRLVFKSQAWYLWGFCYKRMDFRMFRISRMKSLSAVEEYFERKNLVALTDNPEEKDVPEQKTVHLVLKFDASILYRLYDDFADHILTRCDDGMYKVEINFPEDEWVYGYILSFGTYVQVVDPPHIRDIVRERCLAVAAHYDSMKK